MEKRATSRRKVAVAAGARKAVPAKTEKAPARRLPYKELTRFLEQLKEWWVHLGGDVAALEKMLHKLRPGQPLTPAAVKRILALVKRTKAVRSCAFPFPHMDTTIC